MKKDLRSVGKREGVIQIAQTKKFGHELVNSPLATPTGPGGAAGFRNRNGSQIARPEVTNIYLGPFWADKAFVNQFATDLLTHGYLQPLADLHYGTGPGVFLGAMDGPDVSGKTFSQRSAESMIKKLIKSKKITPNVNSLYVFILPDGVTASLGKDKSCSAFCGYHEAVMVGGIEVAYAVLPSSKCQGCGGGLEDFTAVYAHELAEAATDKVPGQGWTADDGSENGDLEAWILLPWGPPSDPKRYTIQGYYTNERGNTVGAWV